MIRKKCGINDGKREKGLSSLFSLPIVPRALSFFFFFIPASLGHKEADQRRGLGRPPMVHARININLACEQALLFGRMKRVSRERASERRSREGQRKGPSLARSREARFACPNRRACSQANINLQVFPLPIRPVLKYKH